LDLKKVDRPQVPRNVNPPGDPQPILGRDPVQEALDARGTAGVPGQAQVQAHGHHLGRPRAIPQQHVRGVAQNLEERVLVTMPPRTNLASLLVTPWGTTRCGVPATTVQ